MTPNDDMRTARYLLATAIDETDQAFLAMVEPHPARYAYHMQLADAARAHVDRLLGYRQR